MLQLVRSAAIVCAVRGVLRDELLLAVARRNQPQEMGQLLPGAHAVLLRSSYSTGIVRIAL